MRNGNISLFINIEKWIFIVFLNDLLFVRQCCPLIKHSFNVDDLQEKICLIKHNNETFENRNEWRKSMYKIRITSPRNKNHSFNEVRSSCVLNTLESYKNQQVQKEITNRNFHKQKCIHRWISLCNFILANIYFTNNDKTRSTKIVKIWTKYDRSMSFENIPFTGIFVYRW